MIEQLDPTPPALKHHSPTGRSVRATDPDVGKTSPTEIATMTFVSTGTMKTSTKVTPGGLSACID